MQSYQKEITKRYAIILLSTMLFIGGFLTVYFTTKNDSNYVHHQNCNAPLGEFALEAGVQSKAVLNICGSDNKSPCIKKVNNLTEAVNYCNLNSKICDRFMYSSQSNTVSIVGLKGTLVDNSQQDLYTRQNGITYKNPSATNTSGEYSSSDVYTIPGQTGALPTVFSTGDTTLSQ